jgi:hypothetical protein
LKLLLLLFFVVVVVVCGLCCSSSSCCCLFISVVVVDDRCRCIEKCMLACFAIYVVGTIKAKSTALPIHNRCGTRTRITHPRARDRAMKSRARYEDCLSELVLGFARLESNHKCCTMHMHSEFREVNDNCGPVCYRYLSYRRSQFNTSFTLIYIS